MTTTFALKIFFELVVIMLFLYGLYHEDKLIAFEDRVLASFKASHQKQNQPKSAPARKARTVSAQAPYSEEEIFAAREQRAMEAAAARKAAARMKAGNRTASAEIRNFPAAQKNHHVA